MADYCGDTEWTTEQAVEAIMEIIEESKLKERQRCVGETDKSLEELFDLISLTDEVLSEKIKDDYYSKGGLRQTLAKHNLEQMK